MRVLTIFVRFGTALYPRAEEEIADIFRRQMPEIDRTVLVVDNALPIGFAQIDGVRTVIGGDNTCREFSAFDRAVQYVGSAIGQYDLVHFATEAFNTLYVDYITRFVPALLDAVGGRPACVGHIDCYNEPVDVLGFHTQHWTRTCFFFMPPREVKLLGRFVSIQNGDGFFSGDPEAPFAEDAPLSTAYRSYITEWLAGRDIGQGVSWHSGFALTRDTLPAFERKAVAIMNEQMFGVRLRAMGCRLVDVTWLASMLARGPARAIAWNTGWRQQLAERAAG